MTLELFSAADLAERLSLPVGFVEDILASDQERRTVQTGLAYSENFGPDDILRLIGDAQRAGDLDEALWRAFLAGHFGRMLAGGKAGSGAASAGSFLLCFGDAPFWTWERVSRHSSDLALYWSLSSVYRLGRTGCFDLLVLIGGMRLLPISAGSCYLEGSTGPLRVDKRRYPWRISKSPGTGGACLIPYLSRGNSFNNSCCAHIISRS